MPTMQEEVLDRLAQNRDVLRRMGVRRLGLFGSAAHGGAVPPRDLDFLVEFQTKSFDAYMDLKDLLEQWFGRPVDLVLADALKPALRDKVLRETVYAPGL